MTKSILIIGGTGAQGSAVVRFLSSTGQYELKCLTRDLTSSWAQDLASVPYVTLISGGYDDTVLADALKGVDYVWVNTNGFAMGEQAETYWGIRIFELSARAGVKHLVYSGLDSAYKLGGYDPKFRIGHFEGKARVAGKLELYSLSSIFVLTAPLEFMSAQPTKPMAWTVIDSGPYIETLSELFAPKPAENSGVAFYVPLGTGAIPFIHLEDLARYVHWAYQTPTQSNGLRLGTATAHVTGQDMATAFTTVTGKPAKYVDIPINVWLDKAFTDLPKGVNTKVGYRTAHDSALLQTYGENFTNWFNVYKASAGNTGLLKKDYARLDEILPDRVKSLEEWMRMAEYTGESKPILKGRAERKAEMPKNA
jgi:uncharacterized protein YbjT (DUF2867 family)